MPIRLADGLRAVVGVTAAGEYLTVVDGVIIGTGTDAASTEALLSTDVEMVQVLGEETAAAARFGRPLRLITTRRAHAMPEVSAREERGYDIRFRSLIDGAEPLIIIDGIVIGRPQGSESGGLAGISPDQIASIEVVKGAAAERLYGARAAGGVIMIRTKK
jgi:TonB-dependent SusC/RagA subfamily outer membrane receptor